MSACGGCGATLSPAESYCRACGAVVQAGTIVHLTPEKRPEDPPLALGDHTRPTDTSRVAEGARSHWPGWSGVSAIAVAIALVGAVLVLASGGQGDGGDSGDAAAAPVTAPSSEPAEAPSPTNGGAGDAAEAEPDPTALRELGFPFGEPLPYLIVVIDDSGTAHLLDLATGTVAATKLAVGVLETQQVREVHGGPTGPIALRANQSRFHLVELADPWPREVEGRRVVAHDYDSGWTWFSRCGSPPCPSGARLRGYGPPGYSLDIVDVPSPTTEVVASGGVLYVEAAGSIVRVDPATDEQQVVAAGSLLDVRGTTLVLRSCAIDLRCPVYVVDLDGEMPTVAVDARGDDIHLSPDGARVVEGAGAPGRADALELWDSTTGDQIPVDPDALRFVTIPLEWSPDGEWLFAVTATSAVVAIRASDGTIHRFAVPGLRNAIVGLVVRTSD